MMTLNPELIKQYWLNFNLVRWILPPILFFILALGVYLPYEVMVWVLLTIGILMGGYVALRSVQTEITDRTWDWQRLSSLSPTQMVIGKLLGVTAYSWYVYGCFLLMMFVYVNVDILKVIFITLYCFFVQSIIFLLGLVCCQYRRSRLLSTIVLLFSLYCLLPGYLLQLNLFADSGWRAADFIWHNHVINHDFFLFASLLIFIAWSLAGSIVTMSSMLYKPKTLLSWVVFNIFVIVYLGGFDVPRLLGTDMKLATGWISPAMFLAFCVYMMLMIENINLSRYRRVWHGMKQGQWLEVGKYFPRWLASCLILVLVVGYGLLTVDQNLNEVMQRFAGEVGSVGQKSDSVRLFMCLLLIGVVRDYCLLHAIRLFSRSDRGILYCLLAMIVTYILLPSMLSAVGPGLIKYIIVLPGEYMWGSILGFVLQIGLLTAYTIIRTRRIHAKL